MCKDSHPIYIWSKQEILFQCGSGQLHNVSYTKSGVPVLELCFK